MATLYPSQLVGRRVHWLLTVEWAGEVLHVADDEVNVEMADGTTLHFSAGLGDIEVSEGIDLFGDSVGQLSVPLEFIPPPGLSVAGLVARGEDLSAARGELARWVEGSTWEQRRVVLIGGLTDPEYGDDGEAVSTSLEERLATDATLTSLPSSSVTASTWAFTASLNDESLDVPYPIIIGRPGDERDGQFVTGSPAVWVDHRAVDEIDTSGDNLKRNVVAVIAGHHVSAARVYLNNDSYVGGIRCYVRNGWDALGQEVAFVGWYLSADDANPDAWFYTGETFSALNNYVLTYTPDPEIGSGVTTCLGEVDSPAYTDPTFNGVEQLPLYVIWRDEKDGGGGLVRNGVTIQAAGDVLEYLLGLTSIAVDWGRFAAAKPLLNQYQLDGCITDRVEVWALLRDEILPLLPVSLVSGPAGIYPVVWRYQASAADAVMVLDADADPGVSRSARVRYDSQDRINRFSLAYQYSYRTDTHMRTLTYGSEADAAIDPGVTVHPLCSWSQTRTGRTTSRVAQTAWIYDPSTAYAVLEWWAAAYALPTRTVTYLVPEVEFAAIERGMVVTLTDAGIACSGAVCLVREVVTDGSGLLSVTLHLIDNPLSRSS